MYVHVSLTCSVTRGVTKIKTNKQLLCKLKTEGYRAQSYKHTVAQFPFFLITPSSSTYLGHHHHQHLHWLDQLAHCQDQLKMTEQQLCINNGHCKQIQPFTCTCSLTHTHSLILFIQTGTQGQNQSTQSCPML